MCCSHNTETTLVDHTPIRYTVVGAKVYLSSDCISLWSSHHDLGFGCDTAVSEPFDVTEHDPERSLLKIENPSPYQKKFSYETTVNIDVYFSTARARQSRACNIVFSVSRYTYLKSSFSDALVLLLEVSADGLCLAFASLRLILPRYHLLQFRVRQLILFTIMTLQYTQKNIRAFCVIILNLQKM